MNHLAIKQLCCIHQQKVIFHDLSFTLASGELMLVEGPNGAGKSSLLRLLSGLATPASGEICWQEKPIHSSNMAYAKALHYIGHTNGLKLALTVDENIRLMQLTSMEEKNNASMLIQELVLHPHRHQPVRLLSAGQKRRLALLRLFLYTKPLWIVDEPFTALDTATQHYFLQHLKRHLSEGGLCILSSHHPIELDDVKVKTVRLGAC